MNNTDGARRPELLSDKHREILDLLGRRWMPRILWELAAGALGFSELRRRCDAMSSSVLTERLDELRVADLASPDDFGAWELTSAGESLARVLDDPKLNH